MKEFCVGKVAEVRCAVLYEKPRSVVNCEYVWRATDLWIEFPWSDKPPIVPARTGAAPTEAVTQVPQDHPVAALRPLAPHTPAPGNVAAPVR